MAYQSFTVSAGDRSIKCGKSTIKASIDTLLAEGYTTITVTRHDLGSSETIGQYKIGDRVKVADNRNYHRFQIGQVVTIVDGESDNWQCTDGGISWWLDDKELTHIQ